MIKSVHDLFEDGSNQTASQRAAFSRFDKLIEVTLHRFEDKIEFPG
jgi:hypothetical protein